MLPAQLLSGSVNFLFQIPGEEPPAPCPMIITCSVASEVATVT